MDLFASVAKAVQSNDATRAAELLGKHPELGAKLNDPAPGGAFGATVLLAAVEHENREMIELLLRHGADIDARSHWWAGSFGVLDSCEPALAPFLIERGATVDAHAAARLGMLDRLEQLVSANPALVHARGGDGQTPLHFASSVDIAAFLLQHGADIDARDVDHESTPAQWMIRERQDVARYLVTRGCRTDMLMAAALGAVELVRRHLEDAPASIRMCVSNEYFPMRNARAGGSIYIWTLGRDKTAHVIAREFGHDEVFALLMERSSEELKLAVARDTGDEALFNELRSKHPDLVRALSDRERHKLVEAAMSNNSAAVRLMLAAGWPLDVRGDLGGTPLHFAAWLGNTEMVHELLQRGASVHERGDQHDMTPLGWALHGSLNSWRKEAGDYAGTVQLLLGAGAQPPIAPADADASEPVLEVLRRAQRG